MNKGKTIAIVVAAAVLAGTMFGGGYLVATKVGGTGTAQATGRDGGPGGTFARLTETEREELQNMTAEERQQFFADKGIEVPDGATDGMPPGGTSGAGGLRRGTSVLEGTIASVAADKITVQLTDGGSTTVYTDASTVIAAVSGKKAEAVKDASVSVYAEQEAEGVTAARTIIVK